MSWPLNQSVEMGEGNDFGQGDWPQHGGLGLSGGLGLGEYGGLGQPLSSQPPHQADYSNPLGASFGMGLGDSYGGGGIPGNQLSWLHNPNSRGLTDHPPVGFNPLGDSIGEPSYALNDDSSVLVDAAPSGRYSQGGMPTGYPTNHAQDDDSDEESMGEQHQTIGQQHRSPMGQQHHSPMGHQVPQQQRPPMGAPAPGPAPGPINHSAGVPSGRILEEASERLSQVIAELDSFRRAQPGVPYPLPPDAEKRFFEQLGRIQQTFKSFKTRIEDDLLGGRILEPSLIVNCIHLNDRSVEFQKQLELYEVELKSLADHRPMVAAALCITSQPFPDSVKQHKPVESPTFVKLLTGARVDAQNPKGAQVSALVVASSSTLNEVAASEGRKRNPSQPPTIGLENNVRELNEQGVAIFDALSFPHGSRLRTIRVKFQMQLPNMTLESSPSHHIVVKTNENQWFEAEGLLLKKYAFGSRSEIPFARFANLLQWRYLSATRQVVETMTRPLTNYDFEFFRLYKFEGRHIITQQDFTSFWEWFGPLLHKIRYQRHLCPLWLSGYICGFLTRDEVQHVLQSEAPGTFLIRVSERVAGRFAIAYVARDVETGQTEVKHYLVKDDDTAGAKKTLADFLGSFTDLNVLLQIWQNPQENKRVLGRCAKDDVLREYYSKRKAPDASGYDDSIEVTMRRTD